MVGVVVLSYLFLGRFWIINPWTPNFGFHMVLKLNFGFNLVFKPYNICYTYWPYCNDSQNHKNKTKMEFAQCHVHLGIIQGAMWHHVIGPCGRVSLIHIICHLLDMCWLVVFPCHLLVRPLGLLIGFHIIFMGSTWPIDFSTTWKPKDFHMAPWFDFDFDLVWPKLWLTINFAYELRLRCCLCHWKSLIDIYNLVLVS